MPLFIVLCLILSFIVQTGQPVQHVLVSVWVTQGTLGIAACIMLGVGLKKLKSLVWFDFFCSSVLLSWFSYWKPLFPVDSLMFFFFPVHFIFTTAFVTVVFINRRNKIDQQSMAYLQLIARHNLTQPGLIMLYVLISLELVDHFLQFPVALSLLITRFALSSCLQSEPE